MVPTPVTVAVPAAAQAADRVRAALVGEAVVEARDRGSADVAICWGTSELRAASDRGRGGAIVAVLGASDATTLRRALEAGADAVVTEDHLELTLAAAVRGAAAGLTVIPRESRRQLTPPSLSHRERQVLTLLVEGCTNAEIASKLFLAESTVKSHLSGAFAKLGVRSRRDAVALILDPSAGLSSAVLSAEAASAPGARYARA
ncbi:MAG TPA: LuxR C-terminal-related transcriptional regulator [Solirubrobacteraceae bacterium]|jgi:DNA-binding NarL/FixJ family response regulator